VTSVRGRLPNGDELGRWELERHHPAPPTAPLTHIWPRPGEALTATRTNLDGTIPPDASGWWIARADALPSSFLPVGSRVIWAAGTRTWQKLAARGVWVNGCADSLGDEEAPRVDLLAGEPVIWRRLTHDGTNDPTAVSTYAVRHDLPADLGARTHFFWTSGRLFLEALARFPSLAVGWHASGPGRTARAIRDALGSTDRVSIWLDYDQWTTHILR
jgi:hydroxymethylbilane synthase